VHFFRGPYVNPPPRLKRRAAFLLSPCETKEKCG
jgi:hypothetical protein